MNNFNLKHFLYNYFERGKFHHSIHFNQNIIYLYVNLNGYVTFLRKLFVPLIMSLADVCRNTIKRVPMFSMCLCCSESMVVSLF